MIMHQNNIFIKLLGFIYLLIFITGCEDPQSSNSSTTPTQTTNTDMSQSLIKLNEYRSATGLNTLTRLTSLDSSSQNHANYITTNNIIGHQEASSNSGFTGEYAPSRAIYAGYANRNVLENLATQSDEMKALRALMSAIYHRFGFLSNNIDEIGYASALMSDNGVFVYNMGNSKITIGCGETFDSGTYYSGICIDTDHKVKESRYHEIRDSNPAYTIWPNSGATDIPPAFYEETPDPLPDYSHSGYPISIEFNQNSVSSVDSCDIKLSHNGTQLDTIVLMNSSNDPNSKFNDFEFALFPTSRLDWGSTYDVEITYAVDGGSSQSINYSFTTTSIANLTTITQFDQEINIDSNTTVAIYLKPHDSFNYLTSYKYTYTTSSAPNIELIDKNSIYFKVTGESGNYVKIIDNNDNTLFKATIK